jgi:hypothetical protein
MTPEERQQKIERYGQAFAELEATLAAIPKDAWKFKPAPNEWSIHELIVHMADSESNSALRARLLAAEPGRPIMAYDQDKWSDVLRYHDQDPEAALQVVKYARLTTYQLLKLLPEEVFEHTVVHSEFDRPYSFDMWLDIYSVHLPDHTEQIKKNYEAWKAQQ